MKKLTTEEFISKANLVHGDQYDYSEIDYIKSTVKLMIKHKKCGMSFLQFPSNHLKGHGCKYCANQYLNTELFIEKSKNIHGKDKYDYSQSVYTTAKNKLKIKCNSCFKIFTQTASDHIQGYGCNYCGGTKKKNFSEFIHDAKIKHGNKFNYNESNFKSLKEKMNIYCNNCKSFFYQQPKKHLVGDGCPKCRIESSGWHKSDFINFCKKNNKGNGIVYLIECFSKDEVFYKIGITSKTVEYRYHNKKSMPYKYRVINSIEMTASEVWDSEKKLILDNKIFKYSPLIPFGGSVNECFLKINDYTSQFFGINHA